MESFGDTFASLNAPCTVRLGKSIDSAQYIEIAEIVVLPKEYRCRFSSKDDRNAVEGIRGAIIFIEKESLPGRAESEFYHFELIGMDVFGDIGSQHIGTVTEVFNYPSMDTLEVKLDAGGSVLLPLSALAIGTIDRAGKRITARENYIEEILR